MSPSAPLQIETFLPYMRDVVRCEAALHELNLMWRLIESSAKMNCPQEAQAILPTMAATRSGFNRLEQELVSSLVSEKVATVLDEIGTKAQYVIDIVVRNLYERTADVGFLATDHELCAFVAGLHDDADADAARMRLRSYASKYTVYDEIILLDTAGNVLVQIDDTTPLEGSSDPLIAQTLASTSYVETFRASDLRPSKRKALIYSRRMLHPQTGRVIGLLCLCFNFEQEMAGIFHSHRDRGQRSNMLLLDGDNCVIESADPLWIPLGAVVPVNQTHAPQLLMFSGRQYLVRTFVAQGYQGYPGPCGWQGQVMVPVDVAFTGRNSTTLASLEPHTRQGLLAHAQSFSAPLFEIMAAAQTIRCVVWNGQVMSVGQQGDRSKLKSILAQISETGDRSNALFSQSIGDLYETVLSTSLHNAEFVSHLLVDLLDRNLYERSDDCRWWAMTPELRSAMELESWDLETTHKVREILAYINALYTVYTRIFVYDRQGRILAGSRLDATAADIEGQQVDAQTLACVLALRSEQDYYVSPFVASSFYGGEPTYVYHAAIRSTGNDGKVLGGIGIVFNATPEFLAMLRGGLDKQQAMQAMYLDRNGCVLASTDAAHPVGSHVALDAAVLQLANGQSCSSIVVHDGQYAIMGCTASRGYREFKVSDGYREDVLAVVFASLGTVQDSPASQRLQTGLKPESLTQAGLEFATFYLQGTLFALPAEFVQEAVSATALTPVPTGEHRARIGLLALTREGADQESVWVFDLGYLLQGQPTRIRKSSQVVILRHGAQTMGLLVDELHGVPEFSETQIFPSPFANDHEPALVKRLIKANGGELLVQVLDVPAFLRYA